MIRNLKSTGTTHIESSTMTTSKPPYANGPKAIHTSWKFLPSYLILVDVGAWSETPTWSENQVVGLPNKIKLFSCRCKDNETKWKYLGPRSS